jgi:hypothetical protein
LVAPAGTPRVLDLPVVLVAVGILQATSVVVTTARVPPLVDSAFAVDVGCGIGSGIRSGIGLGRSGVIRAFITCFSVANNDNGVIQASSAAIIGANNTRFIELEDTATGINSDSKGMSPQLCLDIVDA